MVLSDRPQWREVPRFYLVRKLTSPAAQRRLGIAQRGADNASIEPRYEKLRDLLVQGSR
jgi:hypothetical protein